MEIIEKKAEGEEVVAPPPVEDKTGRVTNLMAALEASLSKAKESAGVATAHRAPRTSRTSRAVPTRRRKSA